MSLEYPTSYRTSAAGTLRAGDAGAVVTLAGWVHRRRDLGSLVFLDLRDREGVVQVSFDPGWTPPAAIEEARRLGPEDVVRIEGTVFPRIAGQHNPDMATGDVEVRAAALEILTRAEPLPIQVFYGAKDELPSEDLRLRHRTLDLRRGDLQHALRVRHAAAQSARGYLSAQGFLEIETPLLTKPTPEGARDFLVPSRNWPGEFYALPQSPQLYKQLLMVSGFDRYFQIARCLRDEDLRADRQPEFTQIDIEMAFAAQDDVLALGEGLMAAILREVGEIEVETPFPRLTYAEAMARYGTDKPDLRFDLPIVDLTDVLRRADFRLFQQTQGTAQRIRGLRVPGGARLSRKELDALQEVAKRGGAAGALWVKRGDDGLSGQFAKALDDATRDAFQGAAGMENGDLFVAVVGEFRVADPGTPGPLVGSTDGSAPVFEETHTVRAGLEPALDELRRHLARKLELVDTARQAWLWVTEFPLFGWDPDADRLVSEHHPFTRPHPDDVAEVLRATKEGAPPAEVARALYRRPVRSLAYDAVWNGMEMCSGSVRIHEPELQGAIFRALGIGPEEAQIKFGFLLEAFRYGAPPHAGVAFGFDRLVMLLAGGQSLRDVIAFPKTASARALFEGAPTPVADDQLREVNIRRTAT
ncbi:MAG: aspartate--tRNA ligase [Longimicrobiaceae bacterium]